MSSSNPVNSLSFEGNVSRIALYAQAGSGTRN